MTLVLLAAIGPVACAHAQAIPPRHADTVMPADHPWGRFPIGSWKRVRVQTETLDATGNVTDTSTTETMTTLEKLEGDCFTLQVEVTVEVAGKTFKTEPKHLVQGYYGQSCDNPVTVTKQGVGEVNIDGKRIATETRAVSFKEGEGRHVSTIQFAAGTTPHILRRESRLLDAAGDLTGISSTVEVLALDLPFKVLTETKACWQTKIVQTHEKRTTVTIEVHCREVPGGRVSHSSKTSDETARDLERSTLELLDFGIGNGRVGLGEDEVQTSRRRIFSRGRGRDGVR